VITYVINLDHKTDRMARMQALLGDAGLRYERVAGVNGRALSEADLAPWSACHPEGPRILSPGEIGCLLSHREAWSRIAAGDGPGVVVEDDIHLAHAAALLLQDPAWLPADADLVKIETTGKSVQIGRKSRSIGHGIDLARLRSAHLGTAGYIATPKAAQHLLETVRHADRALDHVMFDPASPLFAELTTYQTLPALCIQDQFMAKDRRLGLDGEIERAWALNRQKRSLGQKLQRELTRLGQQTVFAWQGSPLNPASDRRNLRIALAPDAR
jgi:glycosyl transferase, family 25